MQTKSKQFHATIQGCPNSVSVSGDLNFAIRKWKKNLKDNDTIKKVFDNKYYEKPSTKRKKMQETAKYLQSK